jgi:hypothetical protein
MPFEWTIDTERRLVTLTGRGRGDFDEATETMRGLARDRFYDPEYAVLADVRELEYNPSLEETRRFVELMDELGILKGRLGIVVATGLQFGIGRQLSAFGESQGRRIEVFTGVKNALRWLDREG